MYFYGYIFTQIPGGWLAGRYGGRRVWGVCQAMCAICTLLTPLAARTTVYFVYTLRFILGMAAGVSFPCVHAMLGRWAPKLERSKLVAFSFAGPPIGTILTFSLSALLCAYGFDNGWGSIFYLAGAGNLVWVCVWWMGTADTPSQHKRIGSLERDYILHSIGERPDQKVKTSTPWRAIFTSGPVWAIITAHMCNNYTNYTLLTSLPTFMKEVLKFDIKRNGALSALPYLCQAVVSVCVGYVADFLRERQYLSTTKTRKILQCTSFLGTAACIGTAGFLTCEQRPLAVFVICLCLAFMGFNRSGYTVNHIDLAPRHAGVLFGITNTAATIPGMVAPLVAGALTPNRTEEEWRTVFYICSATAVLGAVLYGLLADGELQDWAAPSPIEIAIDVTHHDVTVTHEKAPLDTPKGESTLDDQAQESKGKEDWTSKRGDNEETTVDDERKLQND
ncbi:hypothetical protein V1264_007649 [Littorina saxatilis]|uniref:Major facilitator superfamily (MFS) profile domain-containing protein n=2 Tax=Littorina saxatilis TaxID=31220 RepID=A0AAN9AWV7_9CAEN